MKDEDLFNLKHLIIDSVKTTGSYKSKENAPHLFEILTHTEYKEVSDFLNWVDDNGLKFGSGNYEQIVSLYRKKL